MALYETLSSSSTPEEIAAAYKEFTGLAGGDTAAVQKQAVDYLSALGIAAPAITQAYDIYKAPPTGGLPTSDTVSNQTSTNVGGIYSPPTSPADNITSTGGITKSAVTPTSGGVSNVIEGDDIATQIAQLPQEYASWSRSGDQQFMNLIRKSDGAVLDSRRVGDFSDIDLAKIGLSFIPGAGPILAGLNIADAARTGNWMNAAIGATGLIPGAQNLNTTLRVGQAINQNNPFGAVTALAGNTDLQNLVGANNLTIGGYTAKDAVSAANLYNAAQNGQWASVIANAGNLIKSPDAVLAGKALAVMQAAESGNPNALSMAVSAFNSAGGSGGLPTTTGTTKVADSVPLTDEEIADLTADQLRAYQEGGVSGLRDYNRAIKNLTSLTTSGYTGDSMGGNDTLTTTGGLTGGTRSITGTGALNTAGTLDDFENSEITRLRGLGMSNADISAYLENLNNLTASLDSTDTSGLSDFGLAAFRQAKAAGATDLEAMAAANLAISGKYPTGTEVIVTDRNLTETESLPDTTTGIVVTSGRETGKETETETELIVTSGKETEKETEIIVTSGKETERETETETLTEIVVTTASETETETLTEITITDTRTETETETETESESETVTLTEIVVTTASETHTPTETETETITETIITETRTGTETETQTETLTAVVTKIATKPTTTAVSFSAGPAAQGGAGKPIDFLKENLLKTYMTKQSFKDPLAEFTKARTDMMKENMMQQGVDPRLAAILAAKMNGTEAPPAPTYNYGEEPKSIDDILSLKGEGDQYFAQGGYVQPLMAQGGMALPLLAAKGGLPAMHKGREDFRDGKHVAGEGDGQSDDIPAMLADGEFVFPADVVSALGNGSTKAGTDKLYEMMHSIRDRARSKGPKDLPPPALKSPLDYLKKR